MKKRSKRIPLTIILLLSLQAVMAQIPVLEWARQMGGVGFEDSESIALDAAGNIYTTGHFYQTADFDPGPGVFNLAFAGGVDVYVQKLDANGNFLWAKRMGGTGYDNGLAVATDAAGNVYTTGSFEGAVDFDPGVGVANLTSKGGIDIFVQKLDTDGNFVWGKRVGESGGNRGNAIAVHTSGIYVTGYFYETADFDPGPGIANLTSSGSFDAFVQKLDANGNFLWAKKMGGPEWDQGESIAVDNAGNVYTTGSFSKTVDFDPGAGTTSFSAVGAGDIFVQKLDANGNFLWAKQMGGTDGDTGQSIAVDASRNVYMTGIFGETADFNPGAGTANLTAAGDVDIFILKLDAVGNFLWAKQMGGGHTDLGLALTIDNSGNVYTTGIFSLTVDFDPGFGIANLTSSGAIDIFVQKLNTNGDFLWAGRMGGLFGDWGKSIAVDATGNVYTSGKFYGTADFDPYEGTATLTSSGDEQIYVQKLYPCYPTDPVPNVDNLPQLSAMCEITITDAPPPTSTSNCLSKVTATPNVTFPITDQSISQIIWTYDGKNGKVVTQNQAINWVPMDVTTSLSGSTIMANNVKGTYRWLDCNKNGMPLPGETGRSFMPTSTGNYAVEIRENGCIDTSACVTVIILSVPELKHAEKIAVYPNPSSGNLKVDFGKVLKNAILEVNDSQGKLVATTQIQNSSEASIELNESPGLYLLTIKSKDNRKTISFIKE